MRKVAIVALLVLAGCRRQTVVTTAPPAPARPATANVNTPGGATPREALVRFMTAAKTQDVQAMANVWGTKRGPASTDRTYMTVQQMEQRIVVMMRCLRHDSYAIKSENPGTGGDRIFEVELKLGNVVAVANFTATQGPENRFYVSEFEFPKVQAICGAK